MFLKLEIFSCKMGIMVLSEKKVHPIFDWSPHSLGILFKLFGFKIQKFYFSKKLLTKNKDIEIVIFKFLFILSNDQKVLIKIGNGFNKKKIKFQLFYKTANDLFLKIIFFVRMKI